MDRVQATSKVQCYKGSPVHARHYVPFWYAQSNHYRPRLTLIAIKFRSWAQDCGISIDYASVAHPQANGQVERANGQFLAGLKPRLFDELKDYGGKWIYELPNVVWGLRTQQSRATGYSPFFLVYGLEAILPVDLIWNSPRVEQYNEGEADETRWLEIDNAKEVKLKALFQSARYLQGL